MIFINYNQPNLFEHRGTISALPSTPPISKQSKNCTIVLENYDSAFKPGDSVIGKIECTFLEADEVPKAIYAEFSGTAYDKTTFREIKRYCFEKTTLYDNIGPDLLPPGIYSYPFSFVLPKEIPSNYRSETFEINFQIKTIMIRSILPETEFTFSFNVISPIDLNNYPQLAVPYTDCDIQGYVSCCRERPIRLEVSLQKLAFAVGEKFRVTCFLYNQTPLVVDILEMSLMRRIEHTVFNPARTMYSDEIELANCNRRIHEIRRTPYMFRKGEYTMVAEFEIPSGLMIPNFLDCTMLKASYTLHVEAVVPWKELREGNLKVRIPLTFGHIPFDPSLHQTTYSSPANMDEAEKLLMNLVSLPPPISPGAEEGNKYFRLI